CSPTAAAPARTCAAAGSSTSFSASSEAAAMTEAEWLAGENPALMLVYITMGPVRPVSDRKLRLLALAAIDPLRPYISDARFRDILDVEERDVEGTATREEVIRVRGTVDKVWRKADRRWKRLYDSGNSPPTPDELRSCFADMA